MNWMKKILNIISKLERPFSVASANSYANIETLKDFETFVRNIIKELSENEEGRDVATRLEKTFSGYDRLPADKKRDKIIAGKKIIDSLKRKKVIPKAPPENINRFPGLIDVKYAKGVGEQLSKKLSKLNIRTIFDLLLHLPIRYEDRSTINKISSITPGKEETIVGTVIDSMVVQKGFSRRRGIYQVTFKDETGILIGKWFHYRREYMARRFKIGEQFFIHGTAKFNAYNSAIEIIHPETEEYEEEKGVHVGGITPIYPLTDGIQQRRMRGIVSGAVTRFIGGIKEYHTPQLLKRLNLPKIEEAFLNIHSPPPGTPLGQLETETSRERKRLIFDEFFFLELGLALKRSGTKIEERGRAYYISGSLTSKFRKILPFELTGGQEATLQDIEKDLSSNSPMNRLLQGDVGCGKTVVAFHTLLIAIENGVQAAIMAPTEILAEQHYKNFKEWGEKLGLQISFLTSNIKGKTRKSIIESIRSGKTDIVVGTHAVIQDEVDFKNLSMAIIDEQHRFGVMQRGSLKNKGLNPDILIMTATPIPRTLSMTVYGDLDVSIINELPKGRKPVKTKLFFEKGLPRVYTTIEKEIKKGGQAYIIYPLIEETEKSDLKAAITMKEHLEKDIFPTLTIGIVHGKMKPNEKDTIMENFRSGKIDILVSTTVVEVGVDVPNASIMMIEHAERFGLSQLHQLRGRIGRGERESQCILMAHHPISNDGKKRLRVMTESSDGFYIAEKDLEIRGPGQFLGTKQSGLPNFRVANIIRDQKILQVARQEAFRIVKEDPQLTSPQYSPLKDVLTNGYRERFELGKIG